MTRFIHVNGPPGIGKSTIAERLASDRADLVNVDIDVRRTKIDGWRDDADVSASQARQDALVEIGDLLSAGRSVVVPQLVARAAALDAFADVAGQAHAQVVWIMLMTDRRDAGSRWHIREGTQDVWRAHATDLIRREGGDEAVLDYHDRLTALARERSEIVVVSSVRDDIGATYASVCRVLEES